MREELLKTVLLSLLVLLIGCSTANIPESDSDLSDANRSVTDASNDSSKKGECPNKPKKITRDRVISFGKAFEKYYYTNQFLNETTMNVTDVSFTIDNVNSTSLKSGWILHLTVIGPKYDLRGSKTQARGPPLYIANYYINKSTMLRSKSTKFLNPRIEGNQISCPN